MSSPVRAALAALVLCGCAAEHPLAVTPGRGSQAGGEPVRIEGEGFTGRGPVAVYFGVRAAKQVVIESPWLITVLTPQTDTPGTVDVLLRFGDGELTIEDAFEFEEKRGIVLQPEIGG